MTLESERTALRPCRPWPGVKASLFLRDFTAQTVITVCAVLALGVVKAWAQPDTAWVHTYNPDREMWCFYDAEPFVDTSFILTGAFNTVESSEDICVMVVDANGRIQWRRKWTEPLGLDPIRSSSGAGNSIVISSVDTCIYLAGVWASPADGAGLIFRLGLRGDSLWMYSYGGIRAGFFGAVEDPNGGVFAAGHSTALGEHGSIDVILMNVDRDGQERWYRSYGGARNDYCNDLIRTSDGGFALAGISDSFGNGDHFYLVKTDSSGEEEWSGVYRGAGVSLCVAAAELSDGGFVMVGYYQPEEGDRGTDMLIIGVNSDGEELWQHSYGDSSYGYREQFNDLEVLTSGDIVVLGRSSDADHSGILMRFSSDGELRWQKSYNLRYGVKSNSLLALEDGSYAFAGFRNAIQIEGAFLAKTVPDTFRVNDVVLLDPAFPSLIALDIPYPNPFNSSTRIAYTLPSPSDVQLRVYDLMGWEVATLFQGRQMAGSHQALWDGRNAVGASVSSGVYFVRLETPGGGRVNRVVMSR